VAPYAIAKIEDADGKVLWEPDLPEPEAQAIKPDFSRAVTHALRGVIDGGTGAAADIGRPAAGKTGTTQENRDAWFVGYTPKLTAAVWMGYPGAPGEEPRFMEDVHGREVTGGSFPAEIWAKFMRQATKGMETGSFKVPTQFPGRELNASLQLPTSSTTPPSSSSTASTDTTAPPATAPSSTAPPETTTPTSGPPSTVAQG
jgi:membrane peptidoglycan carboxypeptidase